MAENTIPPFGLIPSWMAADKQITFRKLRLFIALSARRNTVTKACFPSLETLSRDTRMAERDVRRILNEAKEDGLLDWEKRGCNHYQLKFMDAIDGVLEAPVLEAPEGREAPKDMRHEAPKDARLEATMNNEDNNEDNNEGIDRDVINLGDFSKKRSGEKKKDRRTQSKATRLPDDWKPRQADVAFAMEQEFAEAQIISMLEDFKYYWFEAIGPKALKKDWDRAWLAWVRKEIKFNGHPNTRQGQRLTKNQIAG